MGKDLDKNREGEERQLEALLLKAGRLVKPRSELLWQVLKVWEEEKVVTNSGGVRHINEEKSHRSVLYQIGGWKRWGLPVGALALFMLIASAKFLTVGSPATPDQLLVDNFAKTLLVEAEEGSQIYTYEDALSQVSLREPIAENTIFEYDQEVFGN